MKILFTLRSFLGTILSIAIFGGFLTLLFKWETLFYVMLAGFVLALPAQVITLILIYFISRRQV